MLVPLWLLIGCGAVEHPIEVASTELRRDFARFEVDLATGYVPGSVAVELDGREVLLDDQTRSMLFGIFELDLAPEGGRHVLAVEADFLEGLDRVTRRANLEFLVPTGMPELVSSWPGPDTRELPRSEWIQLEFASSPPPEILEEIALTCAGRPSPFDVHLAGDRFVILNPVGELPAGAACALEWAVDDGIERLFFTTARAAESAVAHYDREDGRLTAPFPDDYWTRGDSSTATGVRLEVPGRDAGSSLERFARALTVELEDLDGFSPNGHIVVSVSEPLDPASLPSTPEESVHPAASMLLVDLDPRSPDFGRRVPFRAELRSSAGEEEGDTAGEGEHAILVMPALPLAPGGSYGLVVTRAVRADAERLLDPSPFMRAVLGEPDASESLAVERARRILRPLLAVVEGLAVPTIPRDDIALAVRFSVRSFDGLPEDLLNVRESVFDAPLPDFIIVSVTSELEPESPVAAVVEGVWHAPQWLERGNLARDEDGLPLMTGTQPIPFTLAMPKLEPGETAPLVIYQHGNPGSAEEEVPAEARRYLAEAGFAVIGFTDVFNRALRPESASSEPAILSQLMAIFFSLVANGQIPDYWLQTTAEQISLLRLVEALSELDVLPFRSPDGLPDLDVDAPLAYVGVSEGANHAPAFLAYAPEVRTASLVAGGAPIAGMLTHQMLGTSLEELGDVMTGGRRLDIWIGLSLLQTALDRQDAFNFGRYLYREPLPVGSGLGRASVLMIAGLHDTLVPSWASESLAWSLGPIPVLQPVAREVSFLAPVFGPLQANIDDETTAAYHQVAPFGVPGVEATPGCVGPLMSELVAGEGHYCAQIAEESIRLRRALIESALSGDTPVIEDPRQVD